MFAPETPAPAATGASYLYVKSFLREDRAKEAEAQIEGLGMPAGVIQKRVGSADLYIVYSGPYPDAQVASAMQKAGAKGFFKRAVGSRPGERAAVQNNSSSRYFQGS